MDNLKYVVFQVRGIMLYIEAQLLGASLKNGGRINVLMGDYGAHPIEFGEASPGASAL